MECLTTRSMLRGHSNLSELFCLQGVWPDVDREPPGSGTDASIAARRPPTRGSGSTLRKYCSRSTTCPRNSGTRTTQAKRVLSGSASGGSPTASITGCCTRTEPNFSSTGQGATSGPHGPNRRRSRIPRPISSVRSSLSCCGYAASHAFMAVWWPSRDRAAVLAGPPGAGKSTLAAAFARFGYAVLSDDVAVLEQLEGALHVQPAYPQLRLWPDSVALLFGLRRGPALSDSQLGQTRPRSDRKWLLVRGAVLTARGGLRPGRPVRSTRATHREPQGT